MSVTFIISLYCNVLLGNLGPYIHVGAARHTPNTVIDQVHPLMTMAFPDGSCPPAGAICPDILQKLLRNGLRNTTKSRRHWPDHQISQVPILSRTCGTCWVKSSPWRVNPQHTGPKGSFTNVLVPDNTGHTQRSYEHALTVNLHNIKCFDIVAVWCTSRTLQLSELEFTYAGSFCIGNKGCTMLWWNI